jgi:hypothetical protein
MRLTRNVAGGLEGGMDPRNETLRGTETMTTGAGLSLDRETAFTKPSHRIQWRKMTGEQEQNLVQTWKVNLG